MMKVQQNINYQNIQNCIIKYPVIIHLYSGSLTGFAQCFDLLRVKIVKQLTGFNC